jgi:DNA repair exonuclease SbcCD ATPase subunit
LRQIKLAKAALEAAGRENKMSEVKKLTQSIRSHSEFELCYGTIVTLNKIDNAAMRLEERLAEARAEIERLRQELRDNSTMAARQIVPAEMLVDDLTAEIERKDKLIKQMREALKTADILIDDLVDTHVEKCASVYDDDRNEIKAALSAAERK